MKQILSALVFLIIGLGAQAQDVLFSTKTSTLSSSDTVCVTAAVGTEDVVAYTFAVNSKKVPVNLRWKLINFEDQPEGWETAVCDKNLCYPSFVTTNVVIGGNPDKPVFLKENGDSSTLDLHLYPSAIPGTGHAQICVFDKKKPNTVLNCMTYKFTVGNTASGVTTSTPGALEIFPNPTTEYFGLTHNGKVKEIQIFNMLGKKQRTFEAGYGKKYFVGDMPAGMYLATLLDKNGKALKTTRLIKRSYRP